jgi:hypothetical protein
MTLNLHLQSRSKTNKYRIKYREVGKKWSKTGFASTLNEAVETAHITQYPVTRKNYILTGLGNATITVDYATGTTGFLVPKMEFRIVPWRPDFYYLRWALCYIQIATMLFSVVVGTWLAIDGEWLSVLNFGSAAVNLIVLMWLWKNLPRK